MFRQIIIYNINSTRISSSYHLYRYPWTKINYRKTNTSSNSTRACPPCPPCAPQAAPITKICVSQKQKVCPPPPCNIPKERMGFFKTIWWYLWRGLVIYITVQYTNTLGFWSGHPEALKLYDNLYRIWMPVFGYEVTTKKDVPISPPKANLLYYQTGQKWNKFVNSIFSKITSFGVAIDNALKPQPVIQKKPKCPKCTQTPIVEKEKEIEEEEEEKVDSEEQEIQKKRGCYECP